MKLWNVMVPVVELVRAETEDAAIADLVRRLDVAGFASYEGEPPLRANAFESEAANG